jgi:pimeloyl-ACP methyl ester carboxylesterase
MAEDTLELMRQLKIDSASVFGFSDGGILGIDMAIHHPDRVRKLAITGSNFRTDAYSEGTLEWLLTVKPNDWPQEFRENHERLSPDSPSNWPVFLERMQSMWAVEPNYTDEQMASIKAPTLVIAGDQDVIAPEHSVALFRAIPNAQLCVLPDTGHGALPEETILTFLKGPDPSEP